MWSWQTNNKGRESHGSWFGECVVLHIIFISYFTVTFSVALLQ